MNRLLFRMWLQFHKLECIFWNWRLPKNMNEMLNVWKHIDHRKDVSLTGKDFRFWLYLRYLNEKTIPKPTA